MLGEREALVLEVKAWDVHGVGYVDVTVAYRDRSMETARLGRESVPAEAWISISWQDLAANGVEEVALFDHSRGRHVYRMGLSAE